MLPLARPGAAFVPLSLGWKLCVGPDRHMGKPPSLFINVHLFRRPTLYPEYREGTRRGRWQSSAPDGLEGGDVTRLFAARGSAAETAAETIVRAADQFRRATDTYGVNRNINHTNICTLTTTSARSYARTS